MYIISRHLVYIDRYCTDSLESGRTRFSANAEYLDESTLQSKRRLIQTQNTKYVSCGRTHGPASPNFSNSDGPLRRARAVFEANTAALRLL